MCCVPQIQLFVSNRLDRISQLLWFALLTVIAVTLGILAWFTHVILRPLARAVAGFDLVAQGDFGAQVPLAATKELSSLTSSFNQLSSRLHAIFRLIDRINRARISMRHSVCCRTVSAAAAGLGLVHFLLRGRQYHCAGESYRDGRPEATLGGALSWKNTAFKDTAKRPADAYSGYEKNRRGKSRLSISQSPGQQRIARCHISANQRTESDPGGAGFLPPAGPAPIRRSIWAPDQYSKTDNSQFWPYMVKLAEHARLAAIGSLRQV